MTSSVVSPRKKIEGDGRELWPEQTDAGGDGGRGEGPRVGTDRAERPVELVYQNVLEVIFNEEMTEHLGHEKDQAEPDCE